MLTDREVVDALGQWMDANGIGTYDPHAVYSDNNPAPVVLTGAMPDTPDAAVTINIYDWQIDRDDTGNPDVWVQFRFRAAGNDPRIVGDYADKLAAHLLDHTHIILAPGVQVRHAARTVRTPVGMDGNRRYERSDSYRLSMKPTP